MYVSCIIEYHTIQSLRLEYLMINEVLNKLKLCYLKLIYYFIVKKMVFNKSVSFP